MVANTKIEWADHSFNPWWGCTKVSPACDHCYAEAFAKRTGHDVWGKDAERRFFGAKHWNEPLRWNDAAGREGVRRRVFCASMADVFEDHETLWAARLDLMLLIHETPNLDWLLLTKRPQNVRRMVLPAWLEEWPHNVWMGTTVENQRYADLRIPQLFDTPAPKLSLSCEPLLGPVDLWHWIGPRFLLSPIHWVIVGGESGARHRPIDPGWVRALREQCNNARVAFFFKQWGGRTPQAGGRELDGRTWDEEPA